jgi:hypothetical protein
LAFGITSEGVDKLKYIRCKKIALNKGLADANDAEHLPPHEINDLIFKVDSARNRWL